MRIRIRLWSRLLVATAIAATIAPVVGAEEFLGVQIHGFGGWYYGRANDLQFLGAEKDGNAETAEFALNAAARPADRIAIIAQVHLDQDREGGDVELDYAFVDYDLASRLKLRAGRAKHPWGIYGEIFDVGTARPFQHLPQAVYGPVGFTAKAYNGIGLTGSADAGRGWDLLYDLYAGEIYGDYEDSGLFSFETPRPQLVSIGFKNKDVIGGRLQLDTPVQGLSFGVSGYTGEESIFGAPVARKDAFLGHVEYVSDRLLIRAEAGEFEADDSYHGDGAYVEAAYRLTPHWQLAARWDEFHLSLDAFRNFPLPPWLESRIERGHNERIVGLNYWINPNVVVRVSYSRVTGERLLFPTVEELDTIVETGEAPDDESDVFLLGTQFSF